VSGLQIAVSSGAALPLQWQLRFNSLLICMPSSCLSSPYRLPKAGLLTQARARLRSGGVIAYSNRILFRAGLPAEDVSNPAGAGHQGKAESQGLIVIAADVSPDPSSGTAAFRCTMGGTCRYWPGPYTFAAGCARWHLPCVAAMTRSPCA
jgi:L-threonylcarbamoyladenylate synthase